MSNEGMRPCILCHQPTTGSIGAAGYVWESICQICKDEEDRALSRRVDTTMRAVDTLIECITGKKVER